MQRPLLILFFASIFGHVNAQRTYCGVTFDYSSGIGQQYTYGLGINFETRLRGTENVFLNWHYAAGTTTHSDSYMHGPISILFYKNPEWWDFDSHNSSIGGIFGLLIGPAICPVGLTFYSKRTRHTGLRYGFYCNPLELDYWDRTPLAVTDWTIESGFKIIAESRTGACLYVSAGGGITRNVGDHGKQGAGYGDDYLLNMSIGLEHAYYD